MTIKENDAKQLPKITQVELNDIVRKHQMFLTARKGGARALLRDKDLSGLSFVGQNLSQSDFTGCLLVGADLTNTNLESATLFGCDLSQAKLSNTKLNRADLRGAILSNTDLSNADMTGADLREGKTISRAKEQKKPESYSDQNQSSPVDFTGSIMNDAVLTGAQAAAANFSDVILTDAKMQGMDLRGAIFKGSDMSNVDLSQSDIRDTDFSEVILRGAKLDNVEDRGSNFTLTLTEETVGRDIEEYDLTLDEMVLGHINWVASGGRQGKQLILEKTDMRKGVNLSAKKLTAIRVVECTFAEMDLRGIEIQGANLEKSDFRKCKLNNADLRGSNFNRSIATRSSMINVNLDPLAFKKQDGVIYHMPCRFQYATLRHVVFSGSRIREADFTKADLTGADFSNCDLRRAIFTDAVIDNTNFDGAILDGVTGLEKPE